MKKVKILLAAALTVLMLDSFSQGVGINNDESDADPSAILDVKSITQGMLVPRMTVTQAFAISNPAEGLLVFATDVQSFLYYKSGTWNYLTSEFAREVADFDFDTKITTGNGLQPDDDLIKIYCGNSTLERFIIDSMRIAPNMNSVFIGREAGGLSIDGENVAVGDSALHNNSTGYMLDGLHNTAVGSKTLLSNLNGSGNTANGAYTLYQNISGNENTAGGYLSLYNNSSGHSNVALGSHALNKNTTKSNLVAIGDSALYNNGIGAWEPFHSLQNTALGSRALLSNTIGSQNTANGYMALYSNSSGFQNTATGAKALFQNTGTGNTADGFFALNSNISGEYNTALGSRSLQLNETGDYNVAIGYKTLYNNNSSGNVAIGSEASWQSTVAINNSFLGFQSAYSNQGNNNTAVGYQSLYGNEYGGRNTAVGMMAGAANVSGFYNTIIGAYANTNATGYSNSVAIGDVSLITSSNQIRMGDAGVTSIGGYANWTNISDKRFKTNVRNDVPGLEFIRLLEPVTYNLNVKAINNFLGVDNSEKAEILERSGKESMKFSGFLAQDVEAAARKVGYDFSGVDAPKNEKDTYGLRYAEFVVPLVKAVQELAEKSTYQQQMIEELRTEIEVLKEQVKK